MVESDDSYPLDIVTNHYAKEVMSTSVEYLGQNPSFSFQNIIKLVLASITW